LLFAQGLKLACSVKHINTLLLYDSDMITIRVHNSDMITIRVLMKAIYILAWTTNADKDFVANAHNRLRIEPWHCDERCGRFYLAHAEFIRLANREDATQTFIWKFS
jgi:hypothetical protein